MATYYISPTGSDTTGNGTVGNPWAKYSKFYSSSTAGDTCVMAAGTYTYEALNLVNRNLEGAALDSNNMPTSIYNGGGATFAQSTITGTSTCTRVRFTNFTGPAGGNQGVFHYGSSVLTANMAWTDCVWDNITYWLVNAGGLHFGSYDVRAVTCSWTRCLICFISMTGTSGDAQMMRFSGSTAAQTLSMTQCSVYVQKTASSVVTMFGQQSVNTQWTFVNNNFVDYGSLSPAPNITTASINTTNSKNNNWYGLTTVPSLTGNTTSNPLFVDPSNLNFFLRQTSPMIDAGFV